MIPNPNNIMYDKRVVRGNTYAAQILPAVRAQHAALPRCPCKEYRDRESNTDA